MRTGFFLLLLLFPFLIRAQSETIEIDSIVKREVFLAVERMPEFHGGESELMKFISENIVYPPEAIKRNIEGKVFLNFVVESDGSITNIRAVNKNKLGYGCEEAAIEVIKKMPLWKPGTQSGRPVAVYFNIPIRFHLTR